jgi:hypothetical protein
VERGLISILMTALIAALIVEMVIYFAAPAAYSLAARFPFGPSRRLILPPRAREALRAPALGGGAGYRASAMGDVDFARLELPQRLDIDGLVLHFVAARSFAVARMPYSFSSRIYGIVRVDLVPADGGLELRPRFVMLGWPSFIVLTPIAVAAVFATARPSEWTQSFVFGALFVGINFVIGILAGRSRLEAGVTEIERQIQAAITSAEAGDHFATR